MECRWRDGNVCFGCVHRKSVYLLYERLGALVLDVALGRGEQSAHCVHVDAALHEASAGAPQLLQSVVVGGIHHPWRAEQSTKCKAL